MFPNHWEIKWLNILHLPRVFACGQGQLMDEHDILSLRQHDVKPLTILYVPMDAMFICSAVCKLIPRWTRPVKRVSSWRSAMSSLTSFRRGGSSLAARSRKGRWGQIIYVHPVFKWLPAFCCQKLHLPQSLICIRPFGRPRVSMISCFSVTRMTQTLWECHSSSFLALPSPSLSPFHSHLPSFQSAADSTNMSLVLLKVSSY